ncbi:hypothetical protein EVAR_25702_1 [Eumeta japonica]|uniref:CUB domain-containing protein n=1 Tax=Eumeta variegata TaxID=151549 RepID=A0A4C1YQ25_EUMVA|nr:hypothetical protein EVAR_25702_1 [Eumeta japonica]
MVRHDSPVLVRLCGGDAVPDIVSRGPNMLLEFHTSPYDNPFHPVPLSYLPGFELEVQVLYVDKNSHSYVREHGRCRFVLRSSDRTSGVLRNPRHSLPPNTSCVYYFQVITDSSNEFKEMRSDKKSRPNEIVWVSFVKYHSAGTDPRLRPAEGLLLAAHHLGRRSARRRSRWKGEIRQRGGCRDYANCPGSHPLRYRWSRSKPIKIVELGCAGVLWAISAALLRKSTHTDVDRERDMRHKNSKYPFQKLRRPSTFYDFSTTYSMFEQLERPGSEQGSVLGSFCRESHLGCATTPCCPTPRATRPCAPSRATSPAGLAYHSSG